MESLEIILERSERTFSPEEKLAVATEKNDLYRQLLSRMTPADLSGEVKATLDALRAKGMLLAVGSSSRNTRFILERIGLADYFDAVSDGNNIKRSKPDPEVFLKAADYLGLAPGHCLVVEDAVSGLQAAAAAGMDAAAVGDAAGSGLAKYDLGTFADLLRCVD
jgi:beta-phosphoglucomutase